MPKLLVTLPNSGADETYEVSGEVVTIGRSPDNKVQIGHESIASHHAQLVRKNGHYQLKDLSLTRTSCVNGEPVNEALLKGSCILKFGTVECVFRDESAANNPEELSSHLSEARHQIESLVRARDALHEQNRELMKQRSVAQEDREVLVEEISEAKDSLEKAQKDLVRETAERQKLAANAEMAAQFEAEIEKQKREMSAKIVEMERAVEEANQLRGEKSEALKQLATAKEEHDAALARLAENELALGELAVVREQGERTAIELSEAIRAREEAQHSLASAQRQHSEEAERITAELGSMTAKAEAAQTRMAELERIASEMRETAETTEQERSAFEAKLRETEGQLTALSEKQTDHSKLLSETEKLRRQLDDAHLEHKNFARRTHELTSDLEALRAQASGAHSELGAAASAKGELAARLAEAQLQLEQARKDGSAAEETLAAELALTAQELEIAQLAAQRAESFAAELSKAQAELAAASEDRKAAEKHQAEFLTKLSDLQKHTEGLQSELEATRRHDHDLVQQLAQVRDQAAAQSQELQEAHKLAQQSAAKLSEIESELDTVRSVLDSTLQEKQVLAGKVQAQTEQLAASGQNTNAAQASNREFTQKLGKAERRVTELSARATEQETQSRERAVQVERQGSEIRELTKQRDVLLETTRRLAAERERSTANGTPLAGAVPDALLTASAPDSKNGNYATESAADTPPELASWLKRAFHRKKQTDPAPAAKSASAPRFPGGAVPDLNDSHSVSLEFLVASEKPVPGSEAPDPQPSDAPEEKFSVESIQSAIQTVPEPHVFEPRPELLRPAAPELIVEIRRSLQYFIRHTSDLELLHNLLSKIGEISRLTARAGYPLLHTATSALEALFSDLYNTPSRITPATIRTLGQSIDFLHTLLDDANLPRLANAPVLKAIAIEDEPEVLEGIVAALETVKLRTCATRQARPALALLSAQKFDLIVLDVGLPDMNGIELCAKIRGMAQHRKTPIVFLTGMTTVEHRAQSTLHGGNDFIAKPFYLAELSMKAATWMLKGYLGIL